MPQRWIINRPKTCSKFDLSSAKKDDINRNWPYPKSWHFLVGGWNKWGEGGMD